MFKLNAKTINNNDDENELELLNTNTRYSGEKDTF